MYVIKWNHLQKENWKMDLWINQIKLNYKPSSQNQITLIFSNPLIEVINVAGSLFYYPLHLEWGSCIPAECGAATREWFPSSPLDSSLIAGGSSSQTKACDLTWMMTKVLKTLQSTSRHTKSKAGQEAQSRYRVPAVTMVKSPILAARSASWLMYRSPVRDCGARNACSSNGFPSPPSRITYSIPKWACRDPTLSRNQLTAPGLLTFNLTQKAPRHWLITGTWQTQNAKCKKKNVEKGPQTQTPMFSNVLPAAPVELRGDWASRPLCHQLGSCGSVWCPRPRKGTGWWKCSEAWQVGGPWSVSWTSLFSCYWGSHGSAGRKQDKTENCSKSTGVLCLSTSVNNSQPTD